MPTLFGSSTGVCEPCDPDAYCKTCILSDSQCTSCLSGYSLSQMKCISDQNVGLSLTLNTDIDTFMLNIKSFKEGVADILGGNFVGKRRLLTILAINSGSAIVDTTVTVSNG